MAPSGTHSPPADRRGRATRVELVILIVALAAAAVWFVGFALPVRGLDVWTEFDDAGGMNHGAAVKLAGVKIGEVRDVRLTEDNRVRVEFRISEAHAHRLRGPADARACAKDAAACGARAEPALLPTVIALAGPRGLVVHPGRPEGPPLADGAFVPPTGEVASLDALVRTLADERLVRDLPRALARLVPELRRATEGATEAIEDVQRSPVGKLLGQDDDAGDDADR